MGKKYFCKKQIQVPWLQFFLLFLRTVNEEIVAGNFFWIKCHTQWKGQEVSFPSVKERIRKNIGNLPFLVQETSSRFNP
jgi:hypothetical protein